MVAVTFRAAKHIAKKQAFVATIIMLAIVFVIGVAIGKMTGSNLSAVEKFIKANELAANSYIVEQNLMESFGTDCELAKARLTALSDELWLLGKKLSAETAEKDLGSSNYRYLKTKFHLMQAKTYILHKQLDEKCHTNTTVILFYFSRNDEDSGKQGKILDQVVENFGAKVLAIEYNYSKELDFLEEYYRIRKTPSLIINFDKKIEGLASYDDISSIIASKHTKD